MPERSGLDLVIERASLDREFRLGLLVDPKSAIAAAFGVRLPEDFTLRFVERDAAVDLMVVLPDLVDDRLSADQMRRVCGGTSAAGWLFDSEFPK